MLAGAIPSHMQMWSDEEGPFLIQDWRMMFGCRAAAMFASRVSGWITWLLDKAIDQIDLEELAKGDLNPGAPEKWNKLLAMVQELYETRVVKSVDADGKKAHTYEQGPVLAFANFFIDDFPMLALLGQCCQPASLKGPSLPLCCTSCCLSKTTPIRPPYPVDNSK